MGGARPPERDRRGGHRGHWLGGRTGPAATSWRAAARRSASEGLREGDLAAELTSLGDGDVVYIPSFEDASEAIVGVLASSLVVCDREQNVSNDVGERDRLVAGGLSYEEAGQRVGFHVEVNYGRWLSVTIGKGSAARELVLALHMFVVVAQTPSGMLPASLTAWGGQIVAPTEHQDVPAMRGRGEGSRRHLSVLPVRVRRCRTRTRTRTRGAGSPRADRHSGWQLAPRRSGASLGRPRVCTGPARSTGAHRSRLCCRHDSTKVCERSNARMPAHSSSGWTPRRRWSGLLSVTRRLVRSTLSPHSSGPRASTTLTPLSPHPGGAAWLRSSTTRTGSRSAMGSIPIGGGGDEVDWGYGGGTRRRQAGLPGKATRQGWPRRPPARGKLTLTTRMKIRGSWPLTRATSRPTRGPPGGRCPTGSTRRRSCASAIAGW